MPLRRKPALDVSLTGLIYVAIWIFMYLAAHNSHANLLFGIFGLMTGVLAITVVISWLVLRRLEVVRLLPDHGVVGRAVPISYVIRNQKRYWPSLSVTLAELDGTEALVQRAHAYLLHCAAGQTAAVPSELIPLRRGLYALCRLQLSTSFPFGFVKRAKHYLRRDKLLVFPAIAEVDDRLLTRFSSAEVSGMAARPQRDGLDEFYGLKEHRLGENPRLIHWRRSARTGTLVAREMTRVSPPRLLLLLDTYLPGDAPAEARAQTEKVIAMAASLADRALETGISVGIVAWSGGRWTTIAPNRGKRHRRDLLSLLALLGPNDIHDRTELLSAASEMAHGNATAVLMTRHVERHVMDWVRGSPMVLSPMDPATEAYFRFAPGTSFDVTMPAASRARTGRRRWRGRAMAGAAD
jgi:uncharacterized protein (DUF58 family)